VNDGAKHVPGAGPAGIHWDTTPGQPLYWGQKTRKKEEFMKTRITLLLLVAGMLSCGIQAKKGR
jgi:hypothetical protein